MASKEKIDELRRLIERVPVLRVYVDQTPDLKWTLTSNLTAPEINEVIKAQTRPPVLYKEVPCASLGDDLTITVTSEEFADEFIEFMFNNNRDGNN